MISQLISWAQVHWADLIGLYLILVGLASWIVKMFPTLSAGHKFLNILRFIGKWIAIDKYGPAEVKRPI